MNYPFVVSLPHCASTLPDHMESLVALTREEIEDAVDHGTFEIFGSLPAASVIKARWSRLACDLNRDPGHRGPKGVVARTDYHGREIYKEGMYPDDTGIEQIVASHYRPFHEALAAAIDDRSVIGLFDCHSLNGVGPMDAPDAGQARKDVIISNNGDQRGLRNPRLGDITCPTEILQMVADAFSRTGFSVAINDPYTGGFVTVHYGRKLVRRGGFALQVEMNQSLYADSRTSLPDSEKMKDVAARVRGVFDELGRELIAGYK